MIFYLLLTLSLILIILEGIPLFQKYSNFLSIFGIALLSGVIVYASFDPSDYIFGAILIIVLTGLTVLEKTERFSPYEMVFGS